MALAVALIRGIARAGANTIGNFWGDLMRATLWVLLPICLVAATLFLSPGVIPNFHASVQATTVEGKLQKIPQGPVASQEAIKELGTNGGGFFNANSAHQREPDADVDGPADRPYLHDPCRPGLHVRPWSGSPAGGPSSRR
jgi:K+-transporting ATPase ATPase A chain